MNKTRKTDEDSRTSFKHLFKSIKQNFKNEKKDQAAQQDDSTEPNDNTRNIESTTSSGVQATDIDVMETTESILRERPAEHGSSQEQIRVLKTVNETLDQPSEKSTISPRPTEHVETRSDTSRQPSVVPPTVSEMLWDEAYTAVEEQHQTMVSRYESILSPSRDKTASANPTTPILDLEFGNRPSQMNPEAKRFWMKELLDAWLSEEEHEKSENTEENENIELDRSSEASENGESSGNGEESCQEGRADGASQLTPSFRDIIRSSIEATGAEAVPLWIAVCHASKMLLHLQYERYDSCEGLIYIISRMEWYTRLPKLLGDTNGDGINDHGDLRNRIINLYAAVLSYAMMLVLMSVSRPLFGLFRMMRQMQSLNLMQTLDRMLEIIKKEENNLSLFNEDRVKLPLERLMTAARKEMESIHLEKQQPLKGVRVLLHNLHVANPRPGILSSHGEQDRAIRELYRLFSSTRQYDFFRDSDEPCHQLLWVSGRAGQGKKGLLKNVIQALSVQKHKEDEHPCLSYFFFDYRRPEYDNAAAALRNLIGHLLIQQPDLAFLLEDKQETTGRKHFDSPNDFIALSGVFYNMLEDKRFSKTYFVVGSIDECSSDKGRPGRNDIIRLIATSTELSKKIKWLVSSNLSAEIETILKSWNSAGHSSTSLKPKYQHLDLSTDLQDFGTAIKRHIRDKVSELAANKEYDIELKNIVTGALEAIVTSGPEPTTTDKPCQKSLGDYLWVNMVCTALRAEEVWHTEAFLKEIESIRDPESLFSYMGERIQALPKDKELCLGVLRTMAVVRQSLHINDLEPLVCFPPRVGLKAILQKCSAFLQVHDDVVSFQHRLARDHVRRHFFIETSISQYHLTLTHRCLKSVADSLEKRGPHSTNRAHVDQDNILATGNYASLHWLTHLHEISEASDRTEVKHEVFCPYKEVQWFLQEHFLSWVDSLDIETQLPLVVIKMRNLDLCLQERVSYWKELHTIIRDAHLFLRLHESISSPKGSGASNTLLFCPMESRMRKSCMAKALRWIASAPKTDQHWSPDFVTLKGHTDWVRAIAFSMDGRFIASGSDDTTVRIWDAETGTTQHSVELERGWVYSIAFSCKGIVAAGSDDSSVTMLEASTGRILARLQDHDGTVNALCFSPDGTELAAAGSFSVHIWKENSGDPKGWEFTSTIPHEGNVLSVAFSPAGKLLATGAEDCKIRVWNTEARRVVKTLEGHEDEVSAVAFSKDGKLLASGGLDKTVGIWDANSAGTESEGHGEGRNEVGQDARRLDTLTRGAKINSIAFSPDDEGSRLAIATENAIHIWDSKAGTELRVLNTSSNVRAITFAPDGKYLAWGSFDNGVHLCYASEPKDVAPVRLVPYDYGVADLAASPDGRTIAGAVNNSVFLWDVEADKMIQRDMQFEHEVEIRTLVFSPDGNYLLSCSNDSTVRVCEVATGKRLCVLEGHEDWVRGVAWSDSGEYIASASDDGSIRVWKFDGTKEVQVLESAHGGEYVRCVAFGPGGRSLISGGDDEQVVVWAMNENGSWDKKRKLAGHEDYIRSVLMTKDTKRVISASSDETVRIWDIEAGEEIRTPIKIDWVFYKMWVSPQPAEYLMTAQGALGLSSFSGDPQPQDLSPWKLKRDDDYQWWITFKDRDVVFLPSDYEPRAACILKDKVVICTKLMRIYVFGFSKHHTP